MTEEGNMPGPEQRPATGPEQTARNPQDIFESGLRGLIEPQVARNEQGEEVITPPMVEDEQVVRLTRQALAFAGKTPEGLTQLIEKGNELCLNEKIREEDGGWAQWAELVVRMEEHRNFLIKKKQGVVLSGDGVSRERQIPRRDIPSGIGAIFIGGEMDQYIRNDEIDPQENMICHPWESRGTIESFVDSSGKTVEATSRNGREGWLFENYYAATRERGAEQNWYGIVKFWCDDFEASMDWLEGRGDSYPQVPSKEQEEFLRKIKAFGAVFASARAAEASKGDYSQYAMFIAPPKPGESKPDLDKQDHWKDLLLANDERKIDIVLEDPLIRRFFETAISSMGISVNLRGADKDGNPNWSGWKEWNGKIDETVFEETSGGLKKGSLPYYLANGGFDGFIQNVLLNETTVEDIFANLGNYGRHELQAAAKLACDTILVNGMYTLWEYNYDKESKLFASYPNWGGDPFRFMLEPSILPRRIKNVYAENPDVMGAFDDAFRPENALVVKKEEKKEKEKENDDSEKKEDNKKDFNFLVAAGTTNLKKAYRLSAAIFEVLGDSQASGLSSFSEQTVDNLFDAAKLIDYVYGSDLTKPLGKHVAGLMMGRILKTKAYALATEWHKASFRDAFRVFMGSDNVTQAIMEAKDLIWGPERDGSGGLIGKITGGQLRFKVRLSCLGAAEEFAEAGKTLSLFGIPREQERMAKLARTGRFAFRILEEVGRQKH